MYCDDLRPAASASAKPALPASLRTATSSYGEDVNQQYQEFQRRMQLHGLQGFNYQMEIEYPITQGALKYRVWACVGLHDVRFKLDAGAHIYDKYLCIGPCGSRKEAEMEAKLAIMTSYLHVLTTGIYLDPFM